MNNYFNNDDLMKNQIINNNKNIINNQENINNKEDMNMNMKDLKNEKIRNSLRQFETLENPFLFNLDIKNSVAANDNKTNKMIELNEVSDNDSLNDESEENNDNNDNIDNNEITDLTTFPSTSTSTQKKGGNLFSSWGLVAVMTSESFSMEVTYEKTSESVNGKNSEISENENIDNNNEIDQKNNLYNDDKNKTIISNGYNNNIYNDNNSSDNSNKNNNVHNNQNNDKKGKNKNDNKHDKNNNNNNKNNNNNNKDNNDNGKDRKLTEYYNNLYTTRSGNKNKKESYGSCVAFAGDTILISAELGTGKLNYSGVVYIDENVLEYLSYTDFESLNNGEKIPSFGSNTIISRITGFSNSALGLGLIIIIPTLALAALVFYKSTPANQKDIFSSNITPLKKLFTMRNNNYDDDNIDFEIENNDDNHVTYNNSDNTNNSKHENKKTFFKYLTEQFKSNNNNNSNKNNNKNRNNNYDNDDDTDDELEFENEILHDLESDPSSLSNKNKNDNKNDDKNENKNDNENDYLMPIKYSFQNFLALTRGYIKSKQNDYDDNNNNNDMIKSKLNNNKNNNDNGNGIRIVSKLERIEYEKSEERIERRGGQGREGRDNNHRKEEDNCTYVRDKSQKYSDLKKDEKNVLHGDTENVPHLMTVEKSTKVRKESRSRRSRNKDEKEREKEEREKEKEMRSDKVGNEEREEREEGIDGGKEEEIDNNIPLLMRI